MAVPNFAPEFIFRTSRSSGSGGQHVNKVETRVELLFDLEESQLLSEEEKSLLRERWSNRLNKEGILRLVCQKSRSQIKNKEKVIEKFYKLLEKGLAVAKERKESKPGKAAKAKRLAEKRQRSEVKNFRKKIDLPGE